MASDVVAGQPRIGTEVDFSDSQWLGELGDPLAHEVSTALENFPGTRAKFFPYCRDALIKREVNH